MVLSTFVTQRYGTLVYAFSHYPPSSIGRLVRTGQFIALRGMRLRCSQVFHSANIVCSSSGSNTGRISAVVAQKAKELSSSNKIVKTDFNLAPPRGTRDFYPEDQRLKNWLFDIWKDTAGKYGFEEYDAPIIEHAELYIRKAGEEVTQQLYEFRDKGNRHLSLRPEMTPSLARMVLAKKNTLHFPLKWFAIPQCWRYERTTRGRRREHYQWNMDIFGVADVEAEAELLSSIVHSFQTMGISEHDVGIKVNSRKLLNDLMGRVGISEDKWISTCVLVDKLDKVELVALKKEIEEIGVEFEKMEQLCKLLQMTTIDEYIDHLGMNASGVQDILKLFDLVEAYQIKPWIEFDPSVVRGLAYYTGIVFEGFDRKRELRAICGGGRYDKLIESFGGDAVPAVGFGFGDAVIVELLKAKSILPDTTQTKIDVVAFAMKEELRGKMLQVVQSLRARNIKVDVILEQNKKTKSVFQRANRLGASFVMMLAEDEDKVNAVTIKDLRSSSQEQIAYSDIVNNIFKRLHQP